MSTEYKSAEVKISAPVQAVFDRLSNIENLRSMLDNMPQDRLTPDKREMLQNMEITADTITLPGGPTGPITLRVTERRSPELIELKPEGLPLDLSLSLRLKADGEDATVAQAVVDADIPFMLRPMVSGPLQKLLDSVAEVLANLKF